MSNEQYLKDDMPFAVESKSAKVDVINVSNLRKQVAQEQEFNPANTNPYTKGSKAHGVFAELFGG